MKSVFVLALLPLLLAQNSLAADGIQIEFNKHQDRTYVELNVKEIEFSFQHGGQAKVEAPGWVQINAQNPNKTHAASNVQIRYATTEIQFAEEKGFPLDIPLNLLRQIALAKKVDLIFSWDDGRTYSVSLEELDLLLLHEFAEYSASSPPASFLQPSGPTAYVVDSAIADGDCLKQIAARLKPVIDGLPNRFSFTLAVSGKKNAFSFRNRNTWAEGEHKQLANEMLDGLQTVARDGDEPVLPNAGESCSNVNMDTIVLFSDENLQPAQLWEMVELCRLREARLNLVLCGKTPDEALQRLRRIVAYVGGTVELLKAAPE